MLKLKKKKFISFKRRDEFQWNFHEKLKTLKNKASHFLQLVYFLKSIGRVKEWIFLEYNLNISLCQVNNFSSYLNQSEIRKYC